MVFRRRKLIRRKIGIDNRIMGQIKCICFSGEEMKFYLKV